MSHILTKGSQGGLVEITVAERATIDQVFSFSAEVEKALMKAPPSGLFPRDVTKILVGSGVEVTGKVKLGDRVSGELSRLFRAKRVYRTTEGAYRPANS